MKFSIATYFTSSHVSSSRSSCCCQTLQSALLPLDLPLHCAIQLYITHFSYLVCTILSIFNSHIYYLSITIHCHTIYNHMLILHNVMFICIHESILFLTFSLYCLFFTVVIVFCNISVRWLLWQRGVPVCGTIKEY